MTADLLRTLNQAYNISATALKPFGPVWQVFSAKGQFALKRTSGPEERLVGISETLSRIKQAGFLSLILPEISPEKNLPYFKCNNQFYQLFKWRQGEHPSLADPNFIIKTARLFGSLHRFSGPVIKSKDRGTPDLIVNLKQRTAFLEKTVSFLESKQRLNRVDRALLKWSDYYITQARYCLSGLMSTEQPSISNLLVGFCHNDPAPRNIIIQNGQWFLIDFELSARDLLVTEVAKLSGRVLQANSWSPAVFDLMVEAYSRERKLTDWERGILPYLLCFPQHFWRICSQRFEEKLKWSERRFVARLWKITNTERQRLLFLKSRLPELPISGDYLLNRE